MREPGSGTRRAVQILFDRYGVKVQVKLELGSNEATGLKLWELTSLYWNLIS